MAMVTIDYYMLHLRVFAICGNDISYQLSTPTVDVECQSQWSTGVMNESQIGLKIIGQILGKLGKI